MRASVRCKEHLDQSIASAETSYHFCVFEYSNIHLSNNKNLVNSWWSDIISIFGTEFILLMVAVFN